MGAISRLIASVVLLTAAPAMANDVVQWRPIIDEASLRFGVPTRWIERVIQAESGGHTTMSGGPIRSRAGAMGLMQLMPATWGEMRARLALGTNPDDPRDNILAGTFYLRLMYDRFGYPGLFGAYNAGPGAYAEYLAGARRLPGETVAYLKSVIRRTPTTMPTLESAPLPSLFVVRRVVLPNSSATQNDVGHASLFAIRNVVP